MLYIFKEPKSLGLKNIDKNIEAKTADVHATTDVQSKILKRQSDSPHSAGMFSAYDCANIQCIFICYALQHLEPEG